MIPTAGSLTRSLAQKRRQKRIQIREGSAWPEEYVSARSGKAYQPHNDEEAVFVFDDEPRYGLLKGGEGSGKSVAGTVKCLNRLRRGMDGIMVSPELEHFKKSLWPVFREWCPWNCVVERHRYRSDPSWEAGKAFVLTFYNEGGGYSQLWCGGITEDKVKTWRGGNVSFGLFDEASRHRTAAALKLLDGRVRIAGPGGEPTQLFMTTTPEYNWLFEYCGPVQENDKFADFKADLFVATVLTEENADNLDDNYAQNRRQTLSEDEALQLLDAEWIDVSDIEKFVNIIWWDNCREELPALGRSEPMVVAMDAATGGKTSTPDCFAIVGVTRHPHRNNDVAVRYCGIWPAPAGGLLDFEPMELEIRRLCGEYAVIEVAYDPHQLHDMAMRLRKEGVGVFKQFGQQGPRLISDKRLQVLIMGKRLAHDGNPLLRGHVDNANIRKHGEDGIRLVKKTNSLKIDGAVALAMGAERILYYNL